jgi:hypothetical protein
VLFSKIQTSDRKTKRKKQMGQTLAGNVDTSSTGGFTQGTPQATGSPQWLTAVQAAEWKALMAARGYPGADITNQNLLGKPISAPQSIIANPGLPVEAPNAETPLVKNADGSITGKMQGSSVVFNLPTPKA